jgi:ABC-2 type transport system permease protein
MKAIFWKEVKSYFYSPIAYVLIGFFVLLTSIFFWPNLIYQYADFNGVLSTMGFILIFIIPVLTMRILAEDRKNGTEVLLITSPCSIIDIVLGKYLASLFVFLVMIAITFIYPTILIAFGGKLTVQLVGGYVGIILLGASFLSVGLFASSLTENQVIAVVISFVSLLIMWIADSIGNMAGGIVSKILSWFSLISRYQDFNAGILALSPVVYYISFTSVFLFITVRVIERRRWSQG